MECKRDAIKALRQRLGVEPVVFIYFVWVFKMIPIMNIYIYSRISEDKGFPYMNLTNGEEGCGAENHGNATDDRLKLLEIEVQTETSSLILYYIIAATMTTFFIAPFMGPYTDKKGRKPGLVIALTGAMVETILTLLILHLKLPLWTMIVGAFINGLSGSINTILLSVMSYIADSVSPERLGFRYAVMQFTMFIAGTVSQLTSGLWINNFGFKIPVWFLLGCLCAILAYVIFLLEETRIPENKSKVRLFDPSSIKVFIRVFTKDYDAGRKNLYMILTFLGINILATVGTGTAQLLFVLLRPLCWAPSLIGYYLAYKYFTGGLGGAVMISLLKKCLNELNIVRVGYISVMSGLLLFAFSDRTWMVFLGPAVSFARGVTDPIFLDMSSKIVSQDDQGSLFAVVGILSTIGELVGTSLFNNIYPMSLRFGFPGLVFVISAGIFLIILCATFFLVLPADILGVNTNQDEKDKAEKRHKYRQETKEKNVTEGLILDTTTV
ncbi:proton-coupled folate transporter [Nematostella vectensis]|nr:proton-coupled folate transporter [Nematostella vectensis]XP_048580024.1 proton-coupled folate transporter [Nematostella vectensis]